MNKKIGTDTLIYVIVAALVPIILITFVVVMFVFSGDDTVTYSEPPAISDIAPIETLPTPDSSEVPDDTSTDLPVITAPSASSPNIDSPDVSANAPSTEPVTDAPPPVTSSPVAAKTPDDWDPILAETPDAGQEYIDKLVFLGDSTTYGLRFYEMLSGGKQTTQVWTPKSGTLALFNISSATIVYPESEQEEQITVKEALTRKQPEYLVITLGVNGIATMKESVFKTSYGWLIDTVREVSPNTKIICQTMFPVASNYASLGSINNEKIQNGNKWILDVATEKGVKFIDTYSKLVGNDGWLPSELQNGDGLHLNPDGFNIELDNLRTHAYTD